jgi:hypothetical protein
MAKASPVSVQWWLPEILRIKSTIEKSKAASTDHEEK